MAGVFSAGKNGMDAGSKEKRRERNEEKMRMGLGQAGAADGQKSLANAASAEKQRPPGPVRILLCLMRQRA